MIEHGMRHLEFSMEIYKIHIDSGIYFLHEHPASARSWQTEVVQDIMHRRGVRVVRGDMCTFEMQQTDSEGIGYIKKATKFMTNAEYIADRLDQRCKGDHRHTQLISGRANQAEIYPDKLCNTILKGLIEHMKADCRIETGSIGSVAPTDEARQNWK